MNINKILQKKGVDPSSFNNKVKLLVILADIQESLSVELQTILGSAGALNFDVKHSIKQIQKYSEKLRKAATGNLNNDRNGEFGDESDDLREELEKLFNV